MPLSLRPCSVQKETSEDHTSRNSITVKINYDDKLISVNVPHIATVRDLKSVVHSVIHVIPRNQKLITEGDFVLEDDMTLRSSGVTDGTVIMVHPSNFLLRENESEVNRHVASTKEIGVISLSDYSLMAIPDVVWTYGPSTTLLNLSNNFIREIPTKISCLSSLQILLLNSNHLLDRGIYWDGGLGSLRYLTVLDLSYNHLMVLPPALGAMTSLEQLNVSENRLSSIPTEIGLLNRLQLLRVDDNRISTIPTSIGDCCSLIQIDLSTNIIEELPETISNLQNLKALNISNNSLNSLPSTIFKMCSQLKTLDFGNTGITSDILCQFEGWWDFHKRAAGASESEHEEEFFF